MVDSFAYLILAILGLGLLIFIHELGHYWMARRVGMKVEAFGIGFGRPIHSWKWDGVEWRISWLPFGGYVKIAGTDTSKNQDPYSVPGGFFTKKPIDRIKVALAGPVVNLLFALVAFSVIWSVGGREIDYAQFTSKVGWVDPESELYVEGVRPGDEITHYDDKAFHTAKDHLVVPMFSGKEIRVRGYHVNYRNDTRDPFDYTVKVYPNPLFFDQEMVTSGITAPAGFVIYNPSAVNRLPESLRKQFAPTANGRPPEEIMGIQAGDRIVWADGVQVYSSKHLSEILNDGRVLLTVERNGKTFFRRVPRFRVDEIKMGTEMREEVIDWQHEAGLMDSRVSVLYMIPYDVTPNCVVERPLSLLDEEDQEKAFPEHPYSQVENSLEKGDRIIAIDGAPVNLAYQLFDRMQKRKANIIVKRGGELGRPIDEEKVDEAFAEGIDWSDLERIAGSIGKKGGEKQSGNLVLLNPITPRTQIELMETDEKKAAFQNRLRERQKEIEDIENPDLRRRQLQALEDQQNLRILGLMGIEDRKVVYNPNPFDMFANVLDEMWRTLSMLFTGNISPKWLAGPVGIIGVVQASWQVSILEAVFWLGVISLNLGILNLLPIPVLDGGYICIFLVEMITGRRVKAQTIEKLIIPFVLLLIGFFIYITLNDLSRLFGGM